MGQYVLALTVLPLSRALKPKSFAARSVVALLVLFNLMDQPAYIASLHDDSARALQVLEATGIGLHASIALLECSAAVLLVIGGYVSWKILRAYFSGVFGWIERKRSAEAALVLVAFLAAFTFLGQYFASLSELPESFAGAVIFVAFVLIFAFVIIPPAPKSWHGVTVGPSSAALAVIVLLFIETQLIYFFVLPITIPIPAL